ncbi:hypothetical protein [Joostella sp. CR20]|uniref:hypothetical protein n=1 Tax=Joostella sp. CR20 TaxID=2804312 RepID=UPI00313C998C
MYTKHSILYILCALLFIRCGGGGDDSPPPTPLPPTVAQLVFPLENSECTEGVITDANNSTSTITFEWQPSENTDTYRLTIRNLNTNATETLTSETTFRDATLNRGVPYSWYITSINAETLAETQSAVWKFYNAGEGRTTYPPFPADLNEPISGSTVYTTNANITFTWSASDIDNDISSYELFLGDSNPPSTSIANSIINTNYTYATPGAGTYFWFVKTTDAEGNVSNSQVSQFKVE